MDEIIPLRQIESNTDFLFGQLLLINKPLNWTSFDVVNKVRYTIKHRLDIKKIKVGHAGTLDPLATGLIILATGKMTKRIMELQGLDKTYIGSIKFGGSTPTYDAEMEVDQPAVYDHITEEILINARDLFLGEIEQIPPIFSALKKNGVPAYKLARQGKEVVMKKRNVTISQYDLSNINLPDVDFEISCSKGTYIRSLAHDLGLACNSRAYLSKLVRTKIDHFDLKDAWDLEELINALK